MQTQQSRDALRKANKVRSARAQIKRDLHDGTVHIADVFADPRGQAGRMTVRELLTCLYHFGDIKARRFLMLSHIDGATLLGDLSSQRRLTLIGALRAEHPFVWDTWNAMHKAQKEKEKAA